MKRKIITSLVLALPLAFVSCHYGENIDVPPSTRLNLSQDVEIPEAPYDVAVGLGKFTAEDDITKLDPKLVAKGSEIAHNTCVACHSLNADVVVGPGWKGLTKHRTSYWLMNFIANPDPMLDKDPELMEWVKKTSIRMPNPMLSDDEVKAVVSFMIQNDK